MHGGNVLLLEKDSSIASDCYKANRDHLLKLLADYNVKIVVNAIIEKIIDNKILYYTDNKIDGGREFVFNHIVLCIGTKSNELQIENKKTRFFSVGDALHPGKVIDAVWEAYRKVRLL
jgi:NADH dehydrogenase FAD-containing subunit